MLLSKGVKTTSAVLAGLGLVTAAVSNLDLVQGLFYTHFWSVLTVSWVMSIAALWPAEAHRAVGFRPQRRSVGLIPKLRPFGAVIISTLAFALVGSWRAYHISHPAQLPADEPIVPESIPIPVALLPRTMGSLASFAEAQQDGPLEIVDFGVASEKTSYEAVVGISGTMLFMLPDHFTGEGAEPNPRRYDGCTRYRSNTRVLGALRRFVTAEDRRSALQHLSTMLGLENLVRRRAAILRQIIPSGAEWSELRRSDRDIILPWVRDCVGLTQPVLSLTLRNLRNQAVAVTAVNYYMLYADVACDGQDLVEPVVPSAIYAHRLTPLDHNARRTVPFTLRTQASREMFSQFTGEFSTGEIYNPRTGTLMVPPPQRRPVQPSFRVPASDLGSFELHVYSARDRGDRWPVYMAMELETTHGRLRLPEFWIDFPLGSAC